MDPVIELLLKRKSIRAYEDREIDEGTKARILETTLRAPTAGNMMLYSIIEVSDQAIKDTLVKTCDNQPFIAKAPWVLLFLADYQRWHDYFVTAGVEQFCKQRNEAMRKPEEGDLFLACCDAIIAAHTTVVAAESLGIGSCYIGDIMENYELHRELFDLPRYVFPICLLCFGYPTQAQQDRELTERFDRKFIVFENRYRRFDREAFGEMYRARQAQAFGNRERVEGCSNLGQLMYVHKFSTAFSIEMSRSVRAMLETWKEG